MKNKVLKSISVLLVFALFLCFAPSLAACGSDGETNIMSGQDGEDGQDGKDGEDGSDGQDGSDGLSAYEIYCKYHPAYKGTEEDWINAYCNGELQKSYSTAYNIIYTLASIPPVLAALDCIDSGCETYAYIERGKTYSGIEKVDNFYNIGFDTSSNTSAGFSQESFELVVAKIQELNVYGNEKFNIYVQDGTALYAFALAGNAGLTKSQLSVKLLEDGSGAYSYFNSYYLSGKTATAENDEIYDNYVSKVKEVTQKADSLFNSSTNTVSSVSYNLNDAMAIAGIDGYDVEYIMQDQSQLVNLLDDTATGDYHTKLYSALGISGYDDEVEVNATLRYLSISDGVESLSAESKTAYLTLMYGDYYSDTYAALTRTTLSDGVTAALSKKLVFIGTRIRSYTAIATNESILGIGGAESAADIPDSYSDLADKYKSELLFATEDDYNVFLNIFTAATTTATESYTQLTDEVKNEIKVNMFNYYINYICTLKYTYLIYGGEYDIIMKGHPSEVYGEGETWTGYTATGGYDYGWLMDDLIISFHTSDSVGKYIGVMPYGTAAENLAYLGVDIAIGGLPSSTYTGYEESVPVLFVINAASDSDITGDSNLKSRYEAGTLNYTNSDGDEVCTTYYNKGVIYKTLYEYYTAQSNTEMAEKYGGLYTSWLKSVLGSDESDGYYVNDQGIIVQSDAQ